MKKEVVTQQKRMRRVWMRQLLLLLSVIGPAYSIAEAFGWERGVGRTFKEAPQFLSQLQEHFSEDEAWTQLDTIIDWGRYAELFSYVEERGIFRLEAPETQEEA